MNLLENKKTNWKYILVIGILAVLLGAGTLTWQYWWPLIPNTVNGIKIIKWKTFTNTELGFSFKYPAAWGEAGEEFRSGSVGENYIINFSNIDFWAEREINYFYASGKSKDFIRGYGEIGHYDYNGEPDNPNAVINTRLWASGSVIPNFVNIDFNLPNKRISGVRLFIPILSNNDIEKFDRKCPCIVPEQTQPNIVPEKPQIQRQGICVYEDEAKCLGTYYGWYEYQVIQEMYRNRYVGPSVTVEEYLKELEKEPLDSVSQRGIYIFRKIFASSKVL